MAPNTSLTFGSREDARMDMSYVHTYVQYSIIGSACLLTRSFFLHVWTVLLMTMNDDHDDLTRETKDLLKNTF